jgi:glycosyltransferase involved in cell wall biosynthesis
MAFVTTYPPRQCGIATFTSDLIQNLRQIYDLNILKSNKDDQKIIAISNIPGEYNYPRDVFFEIRDQVKRDYIETANFVNLSSIEVVSLQHEFGIYGGPDGSHILQFLDQLKKPVVTTLHTILKNPTPGQQETLENICTLSTLVIVLANKAIDILKNVYNVPEDKIEMIPHGAPDVSFLDTSYYKERFQAENRLVILTFGLLSPDKGIEYAIDAIDKVVKEFPEVLYIILGATHPYIKRHFGEQYRLTLENMVNEKGLNQNIIFQNHFVPLEQLIQFLVAADIYLSPTLNEEQIVSGTLTYALVCGKAIVSTKTYYAEELCGNGRGYLVSIKNSTDLAENIIKLLCNENDRNRMRKNAYQYGRQMVWREVANRYVNAFEQAIFMYGKQHMKVQNTGKAVTRPSIPEIKMDYLYILTDDTGILQHSIFTTPNRYEGYCTDDNARALIVTIMNWRLFNDEKILKLLHIYLAFLFHAFNKKNSRMHNYMSYDRAWLNDKGSEDCHGRALWSLGYTVCFAPNDGVLGLSSEIFKKAISPSLTFSSPRAWAYCILGCLYFLKRFRGDTETKHIITELSNRLITLFKNNGTRYWPWCENVVTYANARLPHALIAAGSYLNNMMMIKQGVNSLKWLLKNQTDHENGNLSIIGNSSWYIKGEQKSQFDQQPIEAMTLMDACYQAYLTMNDKFWRSNIEKCFQWFMGDNDIHQLLYDFRTGGCYDGIHPGGLNLNQGAESTLSWLYALHLMVQI